jgi:hypothetical protein
MKKPSPKKGKINTPNLKANKYPIMQMAGSENRNGIRDLLRGQERQGAHQDSMIDGGRSIDHKSTMQAH